MRTAASNFDVVILGAGVIGVNTAYWLCRSGKSVCVVDRQIAAGLETSFANGGQISVSHAEPWANPSAPLKVLRWLFDGSSPLLFRPRLDVHQWAWIARFLVDCLPARADRHTREIVGLATESRSLLKEIRETERLQYDQRQAGILHFYRSRREFEAALPVAELMRKIGCDRRVISPDEIVAMEPAFRENIDRIVGATYTADDESGDAYKYTDALARRCRDKGVTFLFGSEATAIAANKSGRAVDSIEVRTPAGYETIRARDVVVCLGSHSAAFLRRAGIALSIYPAKGYSITIPVDGTHMPPKVSLTDDQYKLVYSNFGDRLRVAGTAELSGYGLHLNRDRCEAIANNVRALFPNAGDFDNARFWTGLRPTTPSNLPYIGNTRTFSNLWLNTGHGTLGWTMGAGSGRRISDMIDGSRPASPAV